MLKRGTPYGNLTPKEKRKHLLVLENAVLVATKNLEDWQARLAQLKQEMKP